MSSGCEPTVWLDILRDLGQKGIIHAHAKGLTRNHLYGTYTIGHRFKQTFEIILRPRDLGPKKTSPMPKLMQVRDQLVFHNVL